MARLKEIFGLKNTTRLVLLIGGAVILGFIVFSAIVIQMWEYSNSTAFCSYACHDVHLEEPAAYQDSYHARVKCVECHMGRVGTFRAMLLKPSHLQHLPETLFRQYDRPLRSKTLPPASESCERCHWAPASQGDKVLEFRRFRPDEDNTEKRTYLILKVGGGEKNGLARGMGYGIHWHAQNRVEYIATDEDRHDIRWVRAALPDGRTVEYNDVTNPLSAEEIAGAEKRVMDCVDCHNRVGHPFLSPERVIDNALAEGRFSRDLPFVKKEMLALLTADYPNQEAALATVESWAAQYKATYPKVAATQAAAIEQAAGVARELLTLLVFEEPGVTWWSFPDNEGHKDFPGCFRCHDSKHLSAEGESIRLQCNICHAIPVTVDPGDSPPPMPAAALQEPPSHLETNFMADHRFQADSRCAACHGEVTFGSDDSSFCANSVCHGQAWPSVDLDAAFPPHPIPLEGGHAEVWCHNCHSGVKKPSYQCANCHQPPEDHFEAACDACHTPQGWAESAAPIMAQSPQIPHSLKGMDNCLPCHAVDSKVKPAPASHEGRTNEQCLICHAPETQE